MKGILTSTALASALVFVSFATTSTGRAQDTQPTMQNQGQECVGQNCPKGGGMPGGNDQGTMRKYHKKSPQTGGQMDENNNQIQGQSGEESAVPRKKRRMMGEQNNNDNVNVDVRTRTRVGVNEGNWHFDSSRQQRRRSRSATFRFYYGGYWYPQPYWEVYSGRPRYRISCGEGRDIVAERFNRVRVLECDGGTYTYIGRREGDTYRVYLNARSGRIVGRDII
jgi:hypothetical protein